MSDEVTEGKDIKMKEECKSVRERIAVYLAEGMDRAEANGFRTHLRSCKSCREVLNAETRFNRLMRSVLNPQVEPEYWSRTWPRIQVALVAKRRHRSRRVLRWVLSGAGAVATAVTLFLFIFLPSVSTTPIAIHDAAYFVDLPSDPPSFAEVTGLETGDEDDAVELATLSLGSAPPSQRVAHYKNLEGL